MLSPKDILGINGRYLHYIKKYNPDKVLYYADSKLKTKRFMEARGIRVPKLLATIRTSTDLTMARIKSLPADIVVKPNSSSGGSGIIVLTEKQSYGWKTIDGERFTYTSMLRHMKNILEGAFHATGYTDIALVEKRIITHPKVAALTYKGLPDIRIIVFNLVPVIAMLRLPTPESMGKANLHSGGIGAGIDISKGEITYVMQYDKIVKTIPGIGDIQGFKIPHWDDILRIAVQAQHVTNLGYLGVDIALDKNGPLLLELNARAGLSVQVANLVPLAKRLRRVEGLKVKTVAQGIQLAKSMFGRKMERDIRSLSGKTIAGNKEYVRFYFQEGPQEYLAKINPMLKDNYISQDIFDKIKEDHPALMTADGGLRIKYGLLERKSQTLFHPITIKDSQFQVIVGKRELKNYLIDPYKYSSTESPSKANEISDLLQFRKKRKKAELIQEWKETDLALVKIEREMSKHFSLNPLNYDQELETFLMKDGYYNPTFTYKRNEDKYEEILADLTKMEIDPGTPQGFLFENKRKELCRKLDAFFFAEIDPARYTHASKSLFTEVDPEVIKEANKMLFTFRAIQENRERLTPCSFEDAHTSLVKHLESYNLKNWNIKTREGGLSRVGVGKTAKRIIYMNKLATYHTDALPRLWAHEIDTHVLRLENALRQPYQLLHRGTAGYLETEEGLAIFNQQKFTNPSLLRFYVPALIYLKTYEASQHSFAEMVDSEILGMLIPPEDNRDQYLKKAFRIITRAKKGIGDTSSPGGYAKDLVYFSGYYKISKFVENGGDVTELYRAKISLEDLPLIKEMPELLKPVYIPPYY